MTYPGHCNHKLERRLVFCLSQQSALMEQKEHGTRFYSRFIR